MSMTAGESVGRRLATASVNWQNDPRRWVRLALMIYLVISVMVLMSILRTNRRMPLMSSLGGFFCVHPMEYEILSRQLRIQRAI